MYLTKSLGFFERNAASAGVFRLKKREKCEEHTLTIYDIKSRWGIN